MATATKGRKRQGRGSDPMPYRGQPSKLGQVHQVRPDGTEVTVGEAILERIRTAMPIHHAAASVGVVSTTWTSWLRDAARARQRQIRIDQGVEGLDPLTAQERRLVQFLDKVEEAEGQAFATDWTRLGMLAAGSIPVEVVTIVERTDEKGNVLGRSTTTKRDKTLPNFEALKFKLQKRWPDDLGDRLELSGPEGGPIEVEQVASALTERLRRITEARAVEVPREAAPEGSHSAHPPAGLPRLPQALVPSPDADVPAPPD